MNRAFQLLLLLPLLPLSGCGGARLSHAEIRKQVAELGTSTLLPSAVAIRRIVNQSSNRAIAETTVDVAVQLERDSTGSPWHITSVRLGDQNWISIAELVVALNESKKKITESSLEKLTAGVASFRQKNGSAPTGGDIKALSDALHPQYMKDLVWEDAWGRLIEVEATPTLRFRSLGPDGQRGTSDDLVSQ